MNDEDIRTTIHFFARVCPGFPEWRSRHIRSLCGGFPTNESDESKKYFGVWSAALSRHDNCDVFEVLEGIQEGRINKPYFGDAPQTIAREATQIRDKRLASERNQAWRKSLEKRPESTVKKDWWTDESGRVAVCVLVSLGIQRCSEAESHPLFCESLVRCRAKCIRPHNPHRGEGPHKLFGNAGVDLSDLDAELLAGPAKGE